VVQFIAGLFCEIGKIVIAIIKNLRTENSLLPIDGVNLFSPRVNLKIAVLIGLSSLLTLITMAQLAPTTEEPKAERVAFRGVYKPGARKHIGRSGDDLAALLARSMYSQPSSENAAQAAVGAMVPTRSSFIATWQSLSEAAGYRLDVSTTSSFSMYVDGYQDLDVGKATSRIVTGLTPGTRYFYRVRAYNASGTSSNSAVMSAATAAGSGLVINATFDSSILNNPNSAAIEAMINQAIAIYESLFSDPITISILFRYATTEPDGTPLGSGTLAESTSVTYPTPWNTYIAALQADVKTSNDRVANASLPANPLSTNIVPSSANGRAVGLDTPPAMSANGSVSGGPYDGIVTLNSAEPFQFTRPTSANNYDALSATEHEMDEVLGLGSYINSGSNDLQPQDLFSWSSPGTRNITSSGSRYFSIDSGNTDIVGFNQDPTGDFGDWLSESCPQTHPYVQNAFGCMGQFSDVTATSPEGINLDVIGYDLVIPSSHEGDLGNGNTAEGSGALFSLTSGTYNTAMGFQALNKNSTGYQNTANGVNALYSNTTGYYNTANGVDALFRNTTGYQNTANGNVTLVSNTIGINNTASGFGALVSNTSGSNNTATGFEALFRNTTGSNNITLGYLAGYNLTTGSNNIDIANVGVAGEANTIRIGTAGTQSATFIAGISGTAVAGNSVVVDANGQLGTTPSSRRFKEQIRSMDKASEAILALRPVSFRYKYEIDPKGIPQFGLVAEEVEKVNPDLVARDAQGKVYTVRYEAVNAMLLNEFLKEDRKVEEQEETISELRCIVGKEEAAIAQQQKELQSTAAQQQKEIQALAAQLKEQESEIQKVSDQLEMGRSAARAVNNQ